MKFTNFGLVLLAFLMFAQMILRPSAMKAQNVERIRGTVVDPEGAPISGAKVTLLNPEGHPERRVLTDSSGIFSMSELRAGRFTLRVELKGFETSEMAVEVLASANPEPLRITLKIAAVHQSDQQTVRLDDVLQNVSGVIPTNDSYGTNDSFTIRGFDQLGMTYEDGLRLDQYSNSGFPLALANIITVSASGEYAVPDASGATKTDTPIMEIPVSVQVIPQQVLAGASWPGSPWRILFNIVNANMNRNGCAGVLRAASSNLLDNHPKQKATTQHNTTMTSHGFCLRGSPMLPPTIFRLGQRVGISGSSNQL